MSSSCNSTWGWHTRHGRNVLVSCPLTWMHPLLRQSQLGGEERGSVVAALGLPRVVGQEVTSVSRRWRFRPGDVEAVRGWLQLPCCGSRSGGRSRSGPTPVALSTGHTAPPSGSPVLNRGSSERPQTERSLAQRGGCDRHLWD